MSQRALAPVILSHTLRNRGLFSDKSVYRFCRSCASLCPPWDKS